MAKWLQSLEKWIGGGPGGSKRVQSFRWLLILGLVGIGLLLFNAFTHMNVKQVDTVNEGREPPINQQDTAVTATHDSSSSFDTIESTMEASMKGILEKIVGVGEVDAVVTIESTEEVVVQREVKDNQQVTDESDPNGARRHVTQYSRDGQIVTYEVSGNQTPMIVKKIKPKIRGVVIVAKGAENRTVKSLIVDAIEKGFSVPSYKISVAPRKQAK
ncbi:stage III sporulation protein AG [Paenibacillus selenitireducens]|uniref:Stage III sporulation protein AG n=1 Tax=Paenibacillus selenitireducens TaxID=1324314 RepID=A0A1T2XNA4_9BACL|nr:stage III sporulation protein AG [Paenibacillus selenitireducens]OPA81337.1 stage III sporulation protein AG [Paenibacillus selenitireducens]